MEIDMTGKVEAELIRNSMKSITASTSRLRGILVKIASRQPNLLSQWTPGGYEDFETQLKTIEREAEAVQNMVSAP